MKSNGQYYFYQNDHLGTPQKLTAVNGAVVWSAKYSAFGEAEVNLSSTIINNLRFPGQYFDQETGLNYNYFRYYDYVSSRYNRPDPAGIMRGTNHRYLYTKNNPLLFIDPLGLLCKKISSGSYTYVYSYEEIDRGTWIYEKYLQANIGCGCVSYQDLRIDYITKYIDYEFDIYECTEMDECGNEATFIRIDPGVKVSEDVFIESEYGGRERKIEFGTMEGTGGDIESGGGCSCSPNSIEPGWYQHNPVPQNRN
jgi:RHS repeat-associated protein